MIGVTGTKGKSTTATLAAHLARAAGRTVQLAGNIGVPALELLDRPASELAVLELSSYQIADLDSGPRGRRIHQPATASTSTGTARRRRYRADKLRLLALPGVRAVVLNAPRPGLAQAARDAVARRTLYGDAAGWDVDGRRHRARRRAARGRSASCRCRGEHNALNLCAALAALEAVGVPAPALAAGAARA